MLAATPPDGSLRGVSAPGPIDDYVAALPSPLRETAADVRALVDRHLDGARSAVRWGHPTWSVGGDPVCYLRATDDAVLFGFWNGGRLRDPSGRMEAHGSIMGHATLRERDDVDEGLFAAWLREAREMARPLS
jgi:hypothetical protein